MLQHVNDNLGVVEALAGRGSPAIIIGHDWGAPIAAHSALLRPDIFTAVAMLSVPYSPPGGRRPTEAFAEMGRRPAGGGVLHQLLPGAGTGRAGG